MGVEYYLRRDDDRTLFELGRMLGDWEEFLGSGGPTTIGPADQPRLAAEIAGELRDGWMSADRAVVHGTRIARMIVAWADGRPFRFVTEDGFDEWHRDPAWDHDRAVTGTRYLWGGFPALGELRHLERDDGSAYDLGVGTTNWGDELGGGALTLFPWPDHEERLAAALLARISADPRWGPFEFPSGEELPGGHEGYARHVARSIATWSGRRPFRFVCDDPRRRGAPALFRSGTLAPFAGTRRLG